MRGMLDGTRPSAGGPRYSMQETLNNPPAIQDRLPIMIAGSGPQVTLRLVAEYRDMCNMIGPPEFIADGIVARQLATAYVPLYVARFQ